MKPVPRFIVIDSANTLALGVGDTEKEAIAAAAKWLDTPKRVTIHDMNPKGYSKRQVILSEDGIIGEKKKIDDDDEDGHPMGQSG